MSKLRYYLVYVPWLLLSLLPLRVHYLFSDVLYLLVYHVIRYRVRVVRKNLSESYPGKSASELKAIERGFYRWFCDFLVESVKMLTMSDRQLRRRMVFKGTELVDEVIESGQSCAMYMGHYGNWEWTASLPLWVSEKAQCGQLYHVLENESFDRMFKTLRQRWGAVSIPVAEALRRLVAFKQAGQPVVIGFVSDQVPFWNNIHYWLPFLNHDTPVFTGTEKLVCRLDHAAFFMDVRRVRRGYYEAEFRLIARHPQQMREHEITDRYFQMLEERINREPECYLWTHNRWKRTHEEYNIRFDPATGRVNLDPDLEKVKRERGLI